MILMMEDTTMEGGTGEQHMQHVHPKDWKPLNEGLREKMKVEYLLEALRTREKALLEKAIQEAKEPPSVSDDNVALQVAEQELEIATFVEEIRNARKSGHPEKIKSVIRRIPHKDPYKGRLQQEIAEANSDLIRIEGILRLRRSILDMDMKTMSEMRRYHSPPRRIHKVMQAVFLLFNMTEEESMNWPAIQQHLNPHGQKGMNRRILSFDPTTVHPDIAARVRQLLERYQLEKVEKDSLGCATFYVWAMGVVEIVEREKGVGTPADIWRQKELFGLLVDPPLSPRGRRRKGQIPLTARPEWK